MWVPRRLRGFFVSGLVFIFLAGCSSPVVKNFYLGRQTYPSKNEMHVGMSLAEFRKVVESADGRADEERSFDAGGQVLLIGYSYVFREYLGELRWVAFRNNVLVADGLGEAINAEVDMTFNYIDSQRGDGRMSLADAERKKYEKLKSLFPYSRYEDEFFKYRIYLAGRLERKEIGRDEADYLLAQKSNDIQSKSLSDKANFSGSFVIVNQSSFAPFSCTSNRIGSSVFTHCF